MNHPTVICPSCLGCDSRDRSLQSEPSGPLLLLLAYLDCALMRYRALVTITGSAVIELFEVAWIDFSGWWQICWNWSLFIMVPRAREAARALFDDLILSLIFLFQIVPFIVILQTNLITRRWTFILLQSRLRAWPCWAWRFIVLTFSWLDCCSSRFAAN